MADAVNRIVPPSVSLNRPGDSARERKKRPEAGQQESKARPEKTSPTPGGDAGETAERDGAVTEKSKGKILDINI